MIGSSRIVIDGRPMPVRMRARAGCISYRMRLPVPAIHEPVAVRVELDTTSRPWRPRVFAQAPECLRHRYDTDALCMWFERDPDARRWMMSDGLEALAHHIRRHLFQEACCRAGDEWPGDQAPCSHPRPSRCRTCGGVGS